MKQQSVKSAAEILQPVKKYVEMCWNSPKRYHIFCLVEGSFDKHIYENRLNQAMIEVKIATDDNLQHNRDSVEYLVEDLYKLRPKGRFIGIRDKDYMALLGCEIKDNIYTTDNRDLEMTIFASPSFLSSDASLREYLEEVCPLCLHLAYIRIFAESKNLRNKVNDKMSITLTYNQQTRKYVENAKDCLTRTYFEKVDNLSNEIDLNKFIADNQLTGYSYYDLCRGHDVVGLMGWVHGNQYHQSEMEKKMELHYSSEDFYATNLFASIQKYCNKYGVDAKN